MTMSSRHTLDYNVAMGTNGYCLVGVLLEQSQEHTAAMIKDLLYIWVKIMQVSSNTVERLDNV